MDSYTFGYKTTSSHPSLLKKRLQLHYCIRDPHTFFFIFSNSVFSVGAFFLCIFEFPDWNMSHIVNPSAMCLRFDRLCDAVGFTSFWHPSNPCWWWQERPEWNMKSSWDHTGVRSNWRFVQAHWFWLQIEASLWSTRGCNFQKNICIFIQAFILLSDLWYLNSSLIFWSLVRREQAKRKETWPASLDILFCCCRWRGRTGASSIRNQLYLVSSLLYHSDSNLSFFKTPAPSLAGLKCQQAGTENKCLPSFPIWWATLQLPSCFSGHTGTFLETRKGLGQRNIYSNRLQDGKTSILRGLYKEMCSKH